MMVVDSLCFNRDRHKGNFGILFDNETLRPIGMSPIFDLNLSLFSYMSLSDLHNSNYVGEELLYTTPRLGKDFVEIGQSFSNDIIKKQVRLLEDYSFEFRGDDNFSEERIIQLEKIIHKQAHALLNEKKLYISDIFPFKETSNAQKK